VSEDLAKTDFLGVTQDQFGSLLTELGEKPYRTLQIMKWIHHRYLDDFHQMLDISKKLRGQLDEMGEIREPEIITERVSKDGTVKWLMKSVSGSAFETVFIPEQGRGTLCVSSQVGCALNCTFCATARQGFSRNLQASEIIGQLWLAGRLLADAGYGPRAVTNVVMMGMGEPLLNYDAVVSAIRLMLDDLSFGLSRRRVTLSTAGVVPAIDRLAKDCPVSLAVSLHAVEDDIRDQLVPLNRKYPIDQLLHACRRFLNNDSRRRITFEYVMLDGINDSTDHARKLVRLLRDIPAKVNLIPFNSVEGIAYDCSPKLVIDRFREEVLAGGLMTITRRTRGADIAAACGQLAGEVCDRTRRSARYALGGGSR